MLSAKIWVSVLVVFKKSLESTTNISKIQDSRFFFWYSCVSQGGKPDQWIEKAVSSSTLSSFFTSRTKR